MKRSGYLGFQSFSPISFLGSKITRRFSKEPKTIF
jgi:hypothetical protein